MIILLISLVLIFGGVGLAAAGILKWGVISISTIIIIIGAVIASHYLL